MQKRIAILLLVCFTVTFLAPQANAKPLNNTNSVVMELDGQSTRVDAKEKNNGIIEFTLTNLNDNSAKTVLLDTKDRSITYNGKKMVPKIDVVHINPDINMTKEELLELERGQKFSSPEEPSGISTMGVMGDVGSWIPSNPPTTYMATYSLGYSTTDASSFIDNAIYSFTLAILAISYLLPSFDTSKLKENIVAKLALIGAIVNHTTRIGLSGTYYYSLFRTTFTYQIGYVNTYAYKYGDTSFDCRIESIWGTTQLFSTYSPGYGPWYTSVKPW